MLEQLAGFYTGQRVVLIWDGLWAHWKAQRRAWPEASGPGCTAERLPAYARAEPGRGPVGQPFSRREPANCTGDTIAEVADQAHHGIQRVCDSDSLVLGFLAHTGLSPDQPSPLNVKGSIFEFRGLG